MFSQGFEGPPASEVLHSKWLLGYSTVAQQLYHPPLQRSADADLAVLEAFCIILNQGFKKKTNALRQRDKSECWDRTAVHNQCLNRIGETGCSGITFLLAATVSGHTHAEQRGMQPSLCVVLLTHFFQNTHVTFTFVSFLLSHLWYKSFWCGMRASVQCNGGKIRLIRSCCSCFANVHVFFFKPLLYTWKKGSYAPSQVN